MIEYIVRLKPELKTTRAGLPTVKADRIVHGAHYLKFYRDGTPEPVLIVPTANILAVEEVEVKDE